MTDQVATYVESFHNKEMVKEMIYQPLAKTGLEVSKLGFGASGLAGVYMPTVEVESVATVKQAVQSGINYIDTAPWYGNGRSETVLGKAFKTIPRQSYYIATKVGRYEPEVSKMFDFSAERTRQSIDESLQRLDLEYVDIIQVHDMEFAPSLDIIINETLPTLEEIRKSGKARFIGITGYPLDNYRRVLEKSNVQVDTILSYCHGCLHDSSITSYLPYFKSKEVGIINASPLGMRLYSDTGPPDWHPATMEIRQQCKEATKYCQENGVDISKLALNHSLNLPGIATTIVGCERSDMLNKNLNVMKKGLTDIEHKVYEHIMKKFMKVIENKTWEGIEVSRYRTQLAELTNS